MYAVIKTGGKQHRVQPGDVIEVEYMKVDPGSPVEFRPMIVFDDEGKPHVGKSLGRARVMAKLLGEQKGDKVKVFKFRPKTRYSRTQGHRQLHTLLEIEEIALGDTVARKPVVEASQPDEAPKKAAARKPAAKKPAAKKPAAKKPAAKKPSK